MQAQAFFDVSNLWSLFSRNSPATSCRDAAARRRRLGTEGIPLYDELKTLCVEIDRRTGREVGLLHCRADVQFDLAKAASTLGALSPLRPLSASELEERYDATYGTVNPFSEGEQLVHVFDTEVLFRVSAPYTMMTNAGDLTWAVEFYPGDVIDALKRVTEVHVAAVAPHGCRGRERPIFGLLTGNGPESGQVLWRLMNAEIYAGLIERDEPVGDLTYPRVIILSEPEMGLSMELVDREQAVWDVVRRSTDRLCAAGANTIGIACHTTQWFVDRLRRHLGVEANVLSMAEATVTEIESRGIADVTIVGIPVVADLGEYSAYHELSRLGVKAVGEEARPYLQRLGYEVKGLQLGEKDSRALNTLRHVLKVGVSTKNVLVALTEISVLLQSFPKLRTRLAGKNLIDPLQIYAKRLAERFLTTIPGDSNMSTGDDSR